MEEPSRSVRIEVEPLGGATADVPVPGDGDGPKSGGSMRLAVLAGGVGVVALIAALVMLRPDAGQTAAGTDRQAPTTTTTTSSTASTTTSSVPPSTTTVVVETATGLEVNTWLSAVVAAPIGFIAMDEEGSAEAFAPRLWRSIDGREWELIETSFDGAEEEGAGDTAFFTGLERTASGYSVFALSQTFTESREGFESRLVRMVSDQGAVWRIDPAFEPIRSDTTFPIPLRAGWVALYEFQQGQSSLQDLIDAEAPGLVEGDVCFAEMFNDRLRVFPCEGREVDVGAEDLADPDAATGFFRCVTALASAAIDQPTGTLRLLDLNAADERSISFARAPLGAPVVLDDGTLMLIVDAVETGLEPGVCDGFDVVLPEEMPAAVIVYLPNEDEPRVVPFRRDNIDQGFFFAERPVALGQSMVLIGNDALWRVDVDGSWTSLAAVESGNPWDRAARISDDGRFVAIAQRGTMRTYELDPGGAVIAERTIELDPPLTNGGSLLYLTREAAIIANNGPPRFIALD